MNAGSLKAAKKVSCDPQASPGRKSRGVPGFGLPVFGQMFARFQNLFIQLAPLGYEDETGFHYGARPSRWESGVRQSDQRDFAI